LAKVETPKTGLKFFFSAIPPKGQC
jgi:hypothetical protein